MISKDLYVQIWGQKSFWGATVITNLFSAIPWIGTDQVELKPFNYQEISLPIFGIINKKANQKLKKNRENIINIPVKIFNLFKGLIDGAGYIKITKTPKGYIRLGIVINLHIYELPLLEYLKDILKIGRINIYPKINRVQLNISRTDQQEILIPLIIFHNLEFLTYNRRVQYEKLKNILKNNILKFEQIGKKIPLVYTPFTTIKSALDINSWLIGFIMAEGSFNVKKDNSFNFSLKQSNTNLILFEHIAKDIIGTTTKINENKGFLEINISSKGDIKNIIKLIENNISLKGLKLIEYTDWKNKKRKSEIYKDCLND